MNPTYSTPWTDRGLQLRGVAGNVIEVWSVESRIRIGEIHLAEGSPGYSAYYTRPNEPMDSCGEFASIVDAWREIRDRRFQALSAMAREGLI